MKKTVYLIYGISDCPACLHAQAVLMDLYPELEYVFIEMDFSKSYRESIKEELGWPTFPIIVKLSGDEEILVGGYEDLLYVLEKKLKGPT